MEKTPYYQSLLPLLISLSVLGFLYVGLEVRTSQKNLLKQQQEEIDDAKQIYGDAFLKHFYIESDKGPYGTDLGEERTSTVLSVKQPVQLFIRNSFQTEVAYQHLLKLLQLPQQRKILLRTLTLNENNAWLDNIALNNIRSYCLSSHYPVITWQEAIDKNTAISTLFTALEIDTGLKIQPHHLIWIFIKPKNNDQPVTLETLNQQMQLLLRSEKLVVAQHNGLTKPFIRALFSSQCVASEKSAPL